MELASGSLCRFSDWSRIYNQRSKCLLWPITIGPSACRLPVYLAYAIIPLDPDRLFTLYLSNRLIPGYPGSCFLRYFKMRQNDGSELLGPNDPRNLVIGIIHVSPNDDRQSVITAIATQDKLGRDQIVLDLPAQNKAFKSAVDFEGLHHMASAIEATIVLVAPERSKIANLARKENFTVYPSLEELASAEFPPLEPKEAESKANGYSTGAASTTENQAGQEDPAAAPAPPPVQPPPDTPLSQAQVPTTGLPPVQPPPDTPLSQSHVPTTGPPPVQPPPDTPLSQAQVPTTGLPPVQPPPDTPLSQAQVPTTGLPPVQPPPEEDETPTDPAMKQASTPAPTGTQDRNGQPAADRGAAAGMYLPVPMPADSNALVPSSSQLPMYYEPIEQPPRRRSWRGLIITAVIILVLIGLGVLFYRPILDLIFPPTATVTIIPASQQVQHTYQITAVLGVPDPTRNQVDARGLYANSQTQSQTVKATGQGSTPGRQAQGTLTYYNTSTATQTIPAGTVIFDPNGIAVVNDDTITLPALNPAAGLGSVTDAAHTVNVGSAQNIPANDFNDQACCGEGIYVSNTVAFTGGQDAQTFTYVQQSDIDGVVQSLSSSLTQQATANLQGQVRTNEKPVGKPHCTPQETSNHQAGARASTITVSVTVSCVAEVYDMQAVQALATNELTQDASKNPGPAYAPVGDIVTQVVQATPDKSGNILLAVKAGGTWAYQFTPAQRQHFANLIAGKSSQDAKAILQKQTGVAPNGVAITLTGVGVTTLPDDTSRITIDIEAVQSPRS